MISQMQSAFWYEMCGVFMQSKSFRPIWQKYQMGDSEKRALRAQFDGRLKVEFHVLLEPYPAASVAGRLA